MEIKLDKRLVLVLGQNSEVRARLVDGMLAGNAGSHMYVGKNHVYPEYKYLYQSYRPKYCIPRLPVGRGMKSGDSAGPVVAILNHTQTHMKMCGWHALPKNHHVTRHLVLQVRAAFGTLLKESNGATQAIFQVKKKTT